MIFQSSPPFTPSPWKSENVALWFRDESECGGYLQQQRHQLMFPPSHTAMHEVIQLVMR